MVQFFENLRTLCFLGSDVHQPADTELIRAHPELIPPYLLRHWHRDLASLGKLLEESL